VGPNEAVPVGPNGTVVAKHTPKGGNKHLNRAEGMEHNATLI
jgi:hypothetical protein